MRNLSQNHNFHNMHDILKYIKQSKTLSIETIKAYQTVTEVLVKTVLIVNVTISVWSVLVKLINIVIFTKTLR